MSDPACGEESYYTLADCVKILFCSPLTTLADCAKILHMITYKSVGLLVWVYLDGKRVGTIRPAGGGYSYFPLGQKKGGAIYLTIREVRKSIEAAE